MGKLSDFLKALSQQPISAAPSDALVARVGKETPEKAVNWMAMQLVDGGALALELNATAFTVAKMSYRDLVGQRGEEAGNRIREGVTELCHNTIRVQSEPTYARTRRERSHEYGIVRAYGQEVLELSLLEYALVAAPSGRVVPAGWLVRTQIHKQSGIKALVFQAALEFVEESPDDRATRMQ